MQASEVMSSDVNIASPEQSIREAARMMANIDAGVLPVGENDRLVGMITDRDIAIRAVAAGKGPDTPIREIMSIEVKYCFETDDIDEIAQNMADIKLRRLPVLNAKKCQETSGGHPLAGGYCAYRGPRARRPGSLRDFRTGRRALAVDGRRGVIAP